MSSIAPAREWWKKSLLNKVSDLAIIFVPICTLAFLAVPEDLSEREKRLIAEANTRLVCKDTNQCTRYWERAKTWVRSKAEYGIVNETDSIIETYDQVDRSEAAVLTYQAYKLGNIDDWATIDVEVSCNRWFKNCDGDPVEARALFKIHHSMTRS